MSAPLPSPGAPRVPDLEELERACELVKREADWLLERVRDAHRVLQDIDAEELPNVLACGAGYRLRSIARMYSRAQLELVHPDDERASAKAKVRYYLDEAERADGPWSEAA